MAFLDWLVSFLTPPGAPDLESLPLARRPLPKRLRRAAPEPT